MKDDISTPTPDDRSLNAFERDKPGTVARDDAEAAIEKLRRGGGIFVDAVRATRMPMALTDPNLPGNPIVFANEAFLRLSGYRMEEVLGQQPHFMNGRATDPQDKARFAEAIRADQDDIIETVQYRKDGSRFVATVLISAFKDDEGHTLNHFMSWLDVTRRVDAEDEVADLKEVQAALRESETRYRTLFAGMDESFYLVEVVRDEAGEPADLLYLEENEAAVRTTGVSARGTTLRTINPKFEHQWLEIIDEVVRSGQAKRFEKFSPVTGGWHSYHVFPAQTGRDQAGVLSSDITDRHSAIEALRESEERQRFLLALGDAMREGGTGDEMVANAARMLGEHMGASRIVFAQIDDASGIANIREGWTAEDAQMHPATLRLDDFGGPLLSDLRGGKTVRYDDIGDPPYPRSDLAALAAIGVRAGLSVPLVVAGRFVMNLNVHQHEARHWTDAEVMLVEQVAERTWAAIERARAEESLRASEERRALLLQLTDVIRPLADAAEIQAAASRLLAEHLKALRAGFGELKGDEIVVEADYSAHADSIIGRYPVDAFGPTLAKIYRDGGTAILRDAAKDPNISEAERTLYGSLKVAAHVTVAICTAGQPAISLGVQSAEPRDWTEPEIALIKEVAERTWAAVGRARAERALRASEAELADEFADAALLRDLGLKLVTEESLPTIYDEILGAAITIMDSDAGTVQIYDPAAKALVLLVTRGFPKKMTDHFRSVNASSTTACGIALRTGQRTFVDFDDDEMDEACAMHVEAGYRSAQATPLVSRSGGPLGMLNTHWAESRHRPTDRQLRSLDLLARQAADLIERRQSETDLRDSERHAQMLLAELQHRVRNTLAVVRSIARRTADNTTKADDMLAHFQGRLDAFSRVQAALTRSPNSRVDFATLIEDELVAHATREGDQLRIEGPDIKLEPRAAERLSLAVHELATNAVKHGALMNGSGKVSIEWSTKQVGDVETLLFNWTESGVKFSDRKPGREGFGMELLRRSLPYDLQGATKVELTPTGLHFELQMPLPNANEALTV